MIQCPRVLILSGVVPATDRGGGCLALHRHFVERQDFEIMVAGADATDSSAGRVLGIRNSRFCERLFRTRFARLFNNLAYMESWVYLPTLLAQSARSWKPDVIFTVPDNIHSGWASQLARTFGIPLAINLQDLFPISQFLPSFSRPYPAVARWLMGRFHRLHNQADLVFYTSTGMREWFGGHPNGHVLYPMGSTVDLRQPSQGFVEGRRLTIVYAGNCYGAYGRMLLRLADRLDGHPLLSLRIFAAGNDWPASDVQRLRASGVYRGFVPFEHLRQDLLAADAFLTVMSFEREERPFVRTSFTTKWLDYAPCARPVFVWAPEYSSAALFARENDCGVVVGTDDPAILVKAMQATMADRAVVDRLSGASLKVARGILSPGEIHSLLKQQLYRVLPSFGTGTV